MADAYKVVSLSALRKVIAARMTDAKRTIPHFRLVIDIEIDALLALRERENAAQDAVRISVNDCFIKACATALIEHPCVNIQLNGEEIHQFSQADISVVIAVPGGLSTPVIRGANRKTVRDIAAETKSLTVRAAARQLKMEEISGGSFSISNLGSYGIDQFDAIINPPQCGILAVGTARHRMVISEDGEARIAKTVRTTLSLDHRTIDGVTGAAFLATVRQLLERPDGLFTAGAT